MHQSKTEKESEKKEKEKETETTTPQLNGAALPNLLKAIPVVIEDLLSNAIHKLHVYINQQPEELKLYFSKFMDYFLLLTVLPIQSIDKDKFNPEIDTLKEGHPALKILYLIAALADNFISSTELEDDRLKNILNEIKICSENRIQFLLEADADILTTMLNAAQIVDEYGNYYLISQSTGLYLANVDQNNNKQEKPYEGQHVVVRVDNLYFKLAGEEESLRLQTISEYVVSSLHNLLADKKKIVAAPTMLVKVAGVQVTESKPGLSQEITTLSWPIQVSYSIEGILLLDLISLVELVNLLQQTYAEKLIALWPAIISGEIQITDDIEQQTLRELFNLRGDSIEPYVKKIFSYVSQLLPNQPPEDQINNVLALLEKFDSEGFSALCIGSLLTKPKDGKWDNFMVAIDYDEKGEIVALRMVEIDNEHAFGASYFASDNQQRHFTDFKCGVFLMTQMSQSIHENVRERLLVSPALLILTWLMQIYQQQKRYEQMYQNGILTKEDLKKLDYPFKIRPGMIAEMYKKLKTINTLIQVDSQISLASLVEAVEPIVWGCHAKIKTKHSSLLKSMQMLIRGDSIEELYGEQLDRLIGGGPIDGHKTIRAVLENCKITADQYEAECTQELLETVKELLQAIDRKEWMDLEVVTIIAEILQNSPSIEFELPLLEDDRQTLLHLVESNAEENQTLIKLLKYDDFTLVGSTNTESTVVVKDAEQLQKFAAQTLLQNFTALSVVGYPGVSKEIKKIIKNLPHLTYLDLKGSHIDDDVIKQFLLYCPKLQVINLSNISAIKVLKNNSWFESRLACPDLKILVVKNCENLTEIHLLAPALKSVLIWNCQNLKQIEMESKQACQADLSKCDNLKSQAQVKLLLLLNAPVNEKNIKLLKNSRFYCAIEALYNGSIEELGLENCNISKNHLILLVKALEHNTSLKTLNLDNNKINGKSAILLAQALCKNQSLTSLSLKNNMIGDKGIQAFAELLSVNKTLTVLQLRDNKISSACDGFLKEIVAGLHRNKELLEQKNVSAAREQVSVLVLTSPAGPAMFSSSVVHDERDSDLDNSAESDHEESKNKGKEKVNYKSNKQREEEERVKESDNKKKDPDNDGAQHHHNSLSIN